MERSKVKPRVVSPREKVIESLQGVPAYEKLFAAKDAAGRRWNELDARKGSPLVKAEDVAKALQAFRVCLRRLEAFEDAACRAAGVKP